MDPTALLAIASGLLLFGAGYLVRTLRSSLTRVANPTPYPTADADYWLVVDKGGNLALTDEQVAAARDRAERLGL